MMPSQFEIDLRIRLAPLMKKLQRIEHEIYTLVINSISNAQMGAAYWHTQKLALTKLYQQMNTVFNSWAAKELPQKYARSLKLINSRITAAKFITETGKKSIQDLLRTNASMQIMRGLVDTAADSFLSASVAGRQNLKNLFIATQQRLVDESLVNVAVSTGFQMGDLREAKTLLKALFETPAWEAVEKRQFVQAGRFKYKPHYYAEMVARTKFHQAHSQASLVQGFNHGTDLQQVSSHNTTTRICMDFEGKIFSASGRDDRFPPLDDVPPYHPNCLHLIYPAFESAMEVQGTLEDFSEFSLGHIDRPPVPKSFVPVGDR